MSYFILPPHIWAMDQDVLQNVIESESLENNNSLDTRDIELLLNEDENGELTQLVEWYDIEIWQDVESITNVQVSGWEQVFIEYMEYTWWKDHMYPVDIISWFTETGNIDVKIENSIQNEATINFLHTANIQTTIILPEIYITEVYFQGSNERLELYNAGDIDFTGTLTLSGVKSSLLILENISIPAHTAIIISDTLDNLEWINNMNVVLRSGQWLWLTDSKDINISLWMDDLQLDIFFVDNTTMTQAKNTKASLHRLLSNNTIVPTTEDFLYNHSESFLTNPGFVFTTPDDQIPCTPIGQNIQIQEVYRWGDIYAPYIELYALIDIDQTLTFSGTLLSGSLSFDISLDAGQRAIVTSISSGHISSISIYDNQKLSIKEWPGNIVIYGQSWQVLDKIDSDTFIRGLSSYRTDIYDCSAILEEVSMYSPGFDHNFLHYTNSWSASEIVEKIVYIPQPSQCSPSDEIDEPQSDISTGSNQTGMSISGIQEIQIVSVIYDPEGSDTDRESITFRSLVDYPVDISHYDIKLDTRTALLSLTGIILSGQDLIYTGNHRMPNGGTCLRLMQGSIERQVYCYPQEDEQVSLDTIDYTWTQIKIDNVIYDPDGNDTDREQITFSTSGDVDFSHGFYLLTNGTKRNLTKYSGIWSWTYTLTDTFSFPNTKDACVSLHYEDIVFDTYCYSIARSINDGKTNTYQYSDIQIEIVNVEYDPDGLDTDRESITLKLVNPSTVDLSDIRIYIGSGSSNTRRIYGTLSTWDPQTFIGNHRFPNRAECLHLAYNNLILDTYCYDPATNISEDQSYTTDVPKVTIHHIVYDPEGNDIDNEQIHLLIESGAVVDRSQWWYLRVNGIKKNLTKFATWQGLVKLTSSFAFPNTKSSCVQLRFADMQQDEYCYNPESSSTISDTWVVRSWTYPSILAILPNPLGSDTDKEKIILNYSGYSFMQTEGLYLDINGRKMKFTGSLLPGDNTFTANFRFPNSASCIHLGHNTSIIDTFCYALPQQGQRFSNSADTLSQLSEQDRYVLTQTKLKRYANKLCMTYQDTIIKCSSIPAGKLARKQSQQLKLYKSYIDLIHDELLNNRYTIFYHSKLTNYKDLYDMARNEINNDQDYMTLGDKTLPVYDISTRFQLQYEPSLVDYTKYYLGEKLLGDNITTRYTKTKKQRILSLVESD